MYILIESPKLGREEIIGWFDDIETAKEQASLLARHAKLTKSIDEDTVYSIGEIPLVARSGDLETNLTWKED